MLVQKIGLSIKPKYMKNNYILKKFLEINTNFDLKE